MKHHRIAIFASGNGSNAILLQTYFENNTTIDVHAIYTNNPNAGIISKGKELNIPVHILTAEQLADGQKLVDLMLSEGITCIVLAGYLKIIPPQLVTAFPNTIINIHPALLPKYGGKGMYGMHVHKAVKAANEKESGITIHVVNENYDDGKHIAQFSCILSETDSPEDIQTKVQKLEHAHFASTIEAYLTNTL